jgi:hypothetical protein
LGLFTFSAERITGMAAWLHSRRWSPTVYGEYRKYVRSRAPLLKGRTEDCADLSVFLLVEYAAAKGLPLTFLDNANVCYASKAPRQTPGDLLFSKSWNTKDDFFRAVKARVGASSLLLKDTVQNPKGPEPGDLMLKSDHAALVFAVYLPGQRHPRSTETAIPLYPGRVQAARQTNILEYFRNEEGNMIGPPPMVSHFDYLNHRGEGGKQQAELMLYARVDDPDFVDFRFRMFNPVVLENWDDWSGEGKPPPRAWKIP